MGGLQAKTRLLAAWMTLTIALAAAMTPGFAEARTRWRTMPAIDQSGSVVNFPLADGFHDVSCPTPNWCLAVGGSGNLGSDSRAFSATWSSSSGGWTFAPSPPTDQEPNGAFGVGGQLLSVSCLSSSDCLAVGYQYVDDPRFGTYQELLVDRWVGGTWQRVNADEVVNRVIIGAVPDLRRETIGAGVSCVPGYVTAVAGISVRTTCYVAFNTRYSEDAGPDPLFRSQAALVSWSATEGWGGTEDLSFESEASFAKGIDCTFDQEVRLPWCVAIGGIVTGLGSDAPDVKPEVWVALVSPMIVGATPLEVGWPGGEVTAVACPPTTTSLFGAPDCVIVGAAASSGPVPSPRAARVVVGNTPALVSMAAPARALRGLSCERNFGVTIAETCTAVGERQLHNGRVVPVVETYRATRRPPGKWSTAPLQFSGDPNPLLTTTALLRAIDCASVGPGETQTCVAVGVDTNWLGVPLRNAAALLSVSSNVPLAVNTTSLPPARKSTPLLPWPYAWQLQATGGAEPYRWSTENILPRGIRLTADGVLQGIVSQEVSAMSYSFRVTVRDADGVEASKVLTLTVTE